MQTGQLWLPAHTHTPQWQVFIWHTTSRGQASLHSYCTTLLCSHLLHSPSPTCSLSLVLTFTSANGQSMGKPYVDSGSAASPLLTCRTVVPHCPRCTAKWAAVPEHGPQRGSGMNTSSMALHPQGSTDPGCIQHHFSFHHTTHPHPSDTSDKRQSAQTENQALPSYPWNMAEMQGINIVQCSLSEAQFSVPESL